MAFSSLELWDVCAARYVEMSKTLDASYAPLSAMAELIQALKTSGDLTRLWPLISHTCLCVSKVDHWDPKVRFFSIYCNGTNSFTLQCYSRIAQPSGDPIQKDFQQTVEAFWQLSETL